jgi:hypothetical protein
MFLVKKEKKEIPFGMVYMNNGEDRRLKIPHL